MDNDQWLQELKAGDKVAFSSNYGRLNSITTIQSVHKLYVIAGCGIKYNRKTGRQCGATGFSIPRIQPLTPEIETQIEYRGLVSALSNVNWRDYHIDMLRQIHAIIEAANSPTGDGGRG